MKNPSEVPTLANAARRRLLLSLPGGLALTTPVAFIACGGGGGGSEPPARLSLALPASVPLDRVIVVGGAEEMPAAEASVALAAPELGLVSVIHEDGRLVALGLLRAGSPAGVPLGAASSAQALLFIALGGSALVAAERAKLQAALAAHEQSAALASMIESLWATDPYALDGPDPRIGDAVRAALERMAGVAGATGGAGGAGAAVTARAGRERAMGAASGTPPLQRLEPSDAVSGLTVLQADGANREPGIKVQNAKRRPAMLNVYKTGYTLPESAPFELGLAATVWSRQPVAATQSVMASLAGLLSGNAAPLSPVESARLAMPMHSGAERTELEAVLLTPVYDRPEPAFFQEVRYTLEREGWRADLADMYTEVELTLVFGAVLEALGLGGAALSGNIFSEALAALRANATTDVTVLLRQSGMGEALLPGIRAWLVSVSEGNAIVSGAYRVAVATVVRRASAQLSANITAASVSRARMLAFRGAVRALLAVWVVAGVFDAAALYGDLHEGERAHRVNATLVAPKVLVSPSSGQLGKGKEQLLTARVTGALPGTRFVAVWTLSGSDLATLRNSAGQVAPRTLESDDMTMTVATTPSTQGTLAIAVEVFAIDGSERRSLGTATSQLEMTDTRVELSPAAATIERLNGRQAFTATLVASPVDAAQVQYEWRCASQYGALSAGGKTTSAASPAITVAEGNATYAGAANLNGGEIETLTVTAFYLDQAGTRVDIGSASGDVTVRARYTLDLLPSLGDVPTDSPITLTAHVREPLPPGSTVEWTWGHTGVGGFTRGGANIDAASATGRLDTGPAEGAATVTASAIVRTPATATEPAHIVVTQLVSRTLNVKKGLREITFEATGGAFACSDPKACGVSYYGAYLVPRLPKAVSYRAVFSGFGYGPCNRSVTWSTVVGDGGGCSFPITYHPHSSSGPTDMWAVWLGFSDVWAPGAGTCMVTITLAP